MLFNIINWTADPVIFSFTIGGFQPEIRWYGLLFATGFIVGQLILAKIWKIEGKNEADFEALCLSVIISTVVGARLGHVIFYDLKDYLASPLSIFKVWEGGLASHGATIGILFALWLYCRKRPDQPFLWVVDRIVIVVALGAMCIRLGNLMNSEIVGKPTNENYAFVFSRATGLGDYSKIPPGLDDQQYRQAVGAADFIAAQIPRHAAQLYEAISFLVLFLILIFVYNRFKTKTPQGLLFGIFMVYTFTLRFFYEFLKEAQVAFENNLPINMGQILSIPAVIAGVYILYLASKKAPSPSVAKGE